MKNLLIAVALTLAASPLAAQETDTTETAAAPPAYGPALPKPPPKRCSPTAKDGAKEIVVCGAQDDAEFRVKSSAELDPNSKEATDDGQLHAPDVSGDGIFKGPATISGLCLIGGCPPPPAYMINFDELPDAPPGSDADKISKGEKSPR